MKGVIMSIVSVGDGKSFVVSDDEGILKLMEEDNIIKEINTGDGIEKMCSSPEYLFTVHFGRSLRIWRIKD